MDYSKAFERLRTAIREGHEVILVEKSKEFDGGKYVRGFPCSIAWDERGMTLLVTTVENKSMLLNFKSSVNNYGVYFVQCVS